MLNKGEVHMAATLDIIIISANEFSIHKIVKYMNENYRLKIEISKLIQIDNWLWEGERELSVGETLNSCLKNGKIVVIGLKSSLFKNLGIFVEKIDEKYIYTFWVDTESYPELDLDIWNKDICLKIFKGIEQIEKEFGDRVDVIAAGIETNLVYKKDRLEMIHDSENINVWGFDKSIITDDLLGFDRSKIGDRDIFVYTRK